MKAFEKYKRRCCRSCTVESCIDMCIGCTFVEQREIGWRAALEWVRSQPDGSCGVRKCIPMEAIKDELEAK